VVTASQYATDRYWDIAFVDRVVDVPALTSDGTLPTSLATAPHSNAAGVSVSERTRSLATSLSGAVTLKIDTGGDSVPETAVTVAATDNAAAVQGKLRAPGGVLRPLARMTWRTLYRAGESHLHPAEPGCCLLLQ
jgi:hypothetical protein